MTIHRLGVVVSTNWLKEQAVGALKGSKNGRLAVLDTPYISDQTVDGYKEVYLQGHIPGSVYFNLWKCVKSTPTIQWNLPDENCFADYVGSLGIDNNTHVVAYDRFGPNFGSFRAWWLFRLFGHNKVSVLDGGLRKWLEDSYEVTQDVPKIQERTFRVKYNQSLIRDMSAMLENSETHKEQVMDARPEEAFVGGDDFPEGGHMVGAKNLFYKTILNEDGTLKSEHELKQLFDSSGIDLGKPLVAACTKGISACMLAAAANVLGKETVPVYYGSWMEWGQLAPENKIVRGKN